MFVTYCRNRTVNSTVAAPPNTACTQCWAQAPQVACQDAINSSQNDIVQRDCAFAAVLTVWGWWVACQQRFCAGRARLRVPVRAWVLNVPRLVYLARWVGSKYLFGLRHTVGWIVR